MTTKQKLLRVGGGASLIAGLIAGAIWLERKAIVDRFARAELNVRDVQATYRIAQIGPRTERIENLVVGDPRRPDLVAEWVEIDVSVGFSGIVIAAVRAGGVKLRGREFNGKFSFGEVDKLLPVADEDAFSLPDISVDVRNMLVGLETSYGPVGASISGRGNLANGFTGKVTTTSPALRTEDCVLSDVDGVVDFRTRARSIRINGPVRAALANCSGSTASAMMILPDVNLSENLGEWRGKVYAQAAAIDAAGFRARPTRIGNKILSYAISASATFAGNADQTNGQVSVSSNSFGKASYGEGAFAARSDFVGSSSRQTLALTQGRIAVSRFAPALSLATPLRSAVRASAGSPLAPLVATFTQGLTQASQSLRGSSDFSASLTAQTSRVTLAKAIIEANDGISLRMGTRDVISVEWPQQVFEVDSSIVIIGGTTLPSGILRLQGRGRSLTGQAQFLPFRTRDAQIIMTPVDFSLDRNNWSLSTIARIDGPLSGGRITGLRLPVTLRNGGMKQPCLPVSFERLAFPAIVFAPAKLAICIANDAAVTGPTRLTAKIDRTPFIISAQRSSVGFRSGRFRMTDVRTVLGSGDIVSEMRFAELGGDMQKTGLAGEFTGAAGHIGNVPLLLSEGAGQWRYERGAIKVNGALQVADRAANPRFSPVTANDVALTFASNQIVATGTLREPRSSIAIASVDIAHDLGTATGQAKLTVPGLTFGDALQPETLTPITLGVIANVIGSVKGTGRIDWTPKGVSSSGSFRTENLDFAAAFGPVTGLRGGIMLSDLLGLETPQGQVVRLGSINPGIAVTNGEVRYRMLPDFKVQIEGGKWPFSGGSLVLEPTILDLSETATRRLTFTVEGLDAARFINQLEFENIAATGVFDGILPMVFDASGGRIVGGRLIARGGGTLSYVGEVSNQDLGLMGQFAFDALKSMKYDRLAIDLSGAIDGDIVTKVSFAGVNQAPLATKRAKLPVRIIGLDNIPFIFNVTITAPFRQLFETTKSLQDPSALIQRIVPQLQKPSNPVQTKESDPVQ